MFDQCSRVPPVGRRPCSDRCASRLGTSSPAPSPCTVDSRSTARFRHRTPDSGVPPRNNGSPRRSPRFHQWRSRVDSDRRSSSRRYCRCSCCPCHRCRSRCCWEPSRCRLAPILDTSGNHRCTRCCSRCCRHSFQTRTQRRCHRIRRLDACSLGPGQRGIPMDIGRRLVRRRGAFPCSERYNSRDRHYARVLYPGCWYTRLDENCTGTPDRRIHRSPSRYCHSEAGSRRRSCCCTMPGSNRLRSYRSSAGDRSCTRPCSCRDSRVGASGSPVEDRPSGRSTADRRSPDPP
jgi:hypothetical protein